MGELRPCVVAIVKHRLASIPLPHFPNKMCTTGGEWPDEVGRAGQGSVGTCTADRARGSYGSVRYVLHVVAEQARG